MISRFNLPGALLILAIILLWQAAAYWIDDVMVLPRASTVFMTLVEDRAAILHAAGDTLRRASIGFSIALIVMLPLGIVLGRVRLLGDLVEPVIEFLRPLPPIAIVPIAMMTLGIGDAAKLVVIVFGASFPLLINAIDAVKVQDPMQAHLARSLRLRRLERMVLIDLQSAMPRIVAGVRLAITVSIILAVISELIISTDGIGAYLRQAQSTFSMDKVLAAIIAIAIISICVNAATNAVDRRLLEWHYRLSALVGN
jgi:NitT/TauT family transport system permease protein